MKVGPNADSFLKELSGSWKQGQHFLISGGTGSGKTYLARKIFDIRLQRGGAHVVFVCKLQPDETITNEYKGYTRWKEWKRKPGVHERRVILWPDVDSCKTIREMIDLQTQVFSDALNQLSKVGKWAVQIDEGLYFCKRLGLGTELETLYTMGRSANLTMGTLVQRPSFLPLSLYSNSSFTLASQTSERVDVDRLANLGGRLPPRKRGEMLEELGEYDFLFLGNKASPVSERIVNLGK